MTKLKKEKNISFQITIIFMPQQRYCTLFATRLSLSIRFLSLPLFLFRICESVCYLPEWNSIPADEEKGKVEHRREGIQNLCSILVVTWKIMTAPHFCWAARFPGDWLRICRGPFYLHSMQCAGFHGIYQFPKSELDEIRSWMIYWNILSRKQ